MKRIIIALAAAAAFAFAGSSCQKINEDTPVPSQEGYHISIDADICATRTVTDSDFKLSWAANDTILVIVKDSLDISSWGWGSTSAARFVYGGSSFESQSTLPSGEHTLYALYSGNAGQNRYFKLNGGNIPSYKLLDIQSQDSDNSSALDNLPTNDALAGKCTVIVPSGVISLQMYHIFSLMKVNIVNRTGSQMKVNTLKMSADTELAGVYDIDYTSEVPTVSLKASGKKDITVNLTDEVTIEADGSFAFYFLIAPVSNYSGNITLQAGNSEGTTYTKSITASALTFEAGKVNKTDYTITEADDNAAVSLPYTINFKNGQGDATIVNVTMPDALSYVWQQSSSYGMKASAYVNKTYYETESWLVTPYVDFTGVTEGAKMTFVHAAKYFSSAASELSVWARTRDGVWSQLSVDKYPDGTSWNTVTSTVDLTSLNGKIAQIGFKYMSSSSNAATWEIESLAIQEDTEEPITPSTGGTYKKYSGELTEGDYIIEYTYNSTTNYVMKSLVANNRLSYSTVTITGDAITTDNDSLVWHIAKSGDYWTLYNAKTGKYAASTGAANKAQLLDSGTDDKALWSVSGTSTYEFTNKQNKSKDVNCLLRNNSNKNGSYGFACYGSTTGGELTLFKKDSSGETDQSVAPAATVTTSDATSVSKSGACLSGTYSGCSSTPTKVGFQWSTSATVFDNSVSATVQSPFTASLSGLEPSTTYYYRSYTTTYGTGDYSTQNQTFYGEVKSFTTSADSQSGEGTVSGGWLSLCEVPACSTTLSEGQTYSSTADETWGNTKAYIVETTNSMQKIVTHTFSYNDKLHRTYTMLYDGNKRCALWTAFALHGTAYPKNVSRADAFKYDPALPESWQPKLSSSYSGYTRGHQVASADRLTTVLENKQTFYYSNMTPQLSGLNSAGINSLEQSVQNLGYATTGQDTLYVVTGPIFEDGYTTCKDAGDNDCAVPSKYYKCIMKCTFDASGNVTAAKAAGFIFEHVSGASRQSVTVDYVETLTGFDFFTNVPKTVQDAAEANSYTFF